MNVLVEKNSGWTVVRIEGALDQDSAGPVQEKLLATLTDIGGSYLLDLEKVSALDSSGLATLVRFYKEIRTRGGTLALCAVQREAMKVFQLTRLDTIFTILPDNTAKAA